MFLKIIALIALASLGSAQALSTQGVEKKIRDKNGFMYEEELRVRTQASYSFAYKLVGPESPLFFDAFMRSYNAASDLEWRGSSGNKKDAGSWNLTSKLLEYPGFKDELKRMIIEDGFAPEQLPAPDAVECVALLDSQGVCCSGVIVSRTSILTAAHCAKSCAVSVRVEDGSGAVAFKSINGSRTLIFPGFNPQTLEGDVAILKFKENDKVDLPPVALMDDLAVNDLKSIVAVGFGATGPTCNGPVGFRRKAPMAVAAKTCDQPAMTAFSCQKGEFVAGLNLRGVCPADSGGAAFIQNVNGRFLAGLIVQRVPPLEDYVNRFVTLDKGMATWVRNNV
jgi:hypothetical protein